MSCLGASPIKITMEMLPSASAKTTARFFEVIEHPALPSRLARCNRLSHLLNPQLANLPSRRRKTMANVAPTRTQVFQPPRCSWVDRRTSSISGKTHATSARNHVLLVKQSDGTCSRHSQVQYAHCAAINACTYGDPYHN